MFALRSPPPGGSSICYAQKKTNAYILLVTSHAFRSNQNEQNQLLPNENKMPEISKTEFFTIAQTWDKYYILQPADIRGFNFSVQSNEQPYTGDFHGINWFFIRDMANSPYRSLAEIFPKTFFHKVFDEIFDIKFF